MSHNFSAHEQLDWNANLNPLFLFLLILGQSSQLQGNTIATRPWRLNSFSTVAGIYRRRSDKPVPFRRKVFLLTLRVSRGKSFGGLRTPWQWLEGNATNVGWVNRTRRWISTTTSWLGDYRLPTTSHNITQHPVSMSWMSVHRAIPWQSSSLMLFPLLYKLPFPPKQCDAILRHTTFWDKKTILSVDIGCIVPIPSSLYYHKWIYMVC